MCIDKYTQNAVEDLDMELEADDITLEEYCVYKAALEDNCEF